MNEHSLQVARQLAESVEARDPFARGHARAVATTALALGQEVGLKSDQLDALEAAGWLHDVGYLELDPKILTKPGQLSADEFRHIAGHAEIGAGIARSIPSWRDAADLIAHHHERCDGAGYPRGLTRDELPLESRVLAVAETYDSLTAHRAHRSAFAPARVIRALKTAARAQLDVGLVEALLNLLRRLAGGRRLETMSALPPLDRVINAEQQRLRDTFSGLSVNLSSIFDWLMGNPQLQALEHDVNHHLRREGVSIKLSDREVQDRTASRADPALLAQEYRVALARQLRRMEQVVGSRMTRFHLAAVLDHLGAEAVTVCQQYRLCETPRLKRSPNLMTDAPLALEG